MRDMYEKLIGFLIALAITSFNFALAISYLRTPNENFFANLTWIDIGVGFFICINITNLMDYYKKWKDSFTK